MTSIRLKFALVACSLALAGCNSTTGGGAGASAPATGTVVAQGDMPGVCQNAAANKFGASPGNITTQNPVARSFGTLIQGMVVSDTQEVSFDCRFDTSGKFLGLIS